MADVPNDQMRRASVHVLMHPILVTPAVWARHQWARLEEECVDRSARLALELERMFQEDVPGV